MPPPYEEAAQDVPSSASLPIREMRDLHIDPHPQASSSRSPQPMNVDGDDLDMPPLEPAMPLPSASRNTRRARVDEEEDEDDQRQTNRQRMHSPPTDRHDHAHEHHFHPDMHAHAQERNEQNRQPGAGAGRPPLPFNRISFTVDILPPLAAMPQATPDNGEQPAAGRRGPPHMMPAFEFRFPIPPMATPAGPNGDAGNAPPPPNGAPNADFATFFQQLLRERMGDIQWGTFSGYNVEEPDDPKRARRLLQGLEEVPEGLVKRLERVSADEGVVCAVCFENLLNPESAGLNEDEKKAEADPMPVDEGDSTASSASAEAEEEVSEEQKKADEALDRKIVVLPCAHVFHASCLRPWFTRPHRTTCPTCRFDIDPESLTYVPPARPARRRAPAGPTPAPVFPGDAQPQPAPAGPQPHAEAADAPHPADEHNAPLPPLGAQVPPPHPGAGPHDMPYIIFDVSMIVPVPVRPGQGQPQAQPNGAAPQVPIFGPAPPPPAANPSGAQPTPAAQPGLTQFVTEQIEQLLNRQQQAPNAAADAGTNAPRPQSAPAAAPQPQAAAGQNGAPRRDGAGPRIHWHPLPLGSQFQGAPAGQQGEGRHGGLGGMFANLFNFGRHQPNTQTNTDAQEPRPAPTAASAAAPPPPPTNQPPLPSFEEFMHLVGLPVHPHHAQPPRPAGGAQGAQPQPPAPGAPVEGAPAPQQPQPQQDANPNAPFMDGLRDMVTSAFDQIFPPGLFIPIPMPTGMQGAAQHPHPPPPPPGPFPFTVPTTPRTGAPRTATPEKRQWTPPPPPGPTLRERVENKEREMGLRCSDISCGLGPSDDDPVPVIDPRTIRQVALRPLPGQEGKDRVCEHAFHPACLVSAERVAGWSGADQKREPDGEDEEVQVSCPVCRAVGRISREDWEEGACALA